MNRLRKWGCVLALLGMIAFVAHFEHEGHDHSKNLKEHDCICHTTGMTSPATLEVVSSVTLIETLRMERITFVRENTPLSIHQPRAPPAISAS